MSLQLDLYKKLYLCRAAEDGIIKHYGEDEMRTAMHMSYGQEIIPVGVCHALSDEDQVFGTHRSHALYLAKSGNLVKFFSEMYGKTTGIVNGKAGSMHLSDPSKGFLGASSIVASTIPVSIGSAFANKYKKNGCISVPFFGDGATNEGDFWESINIATALKLPVLFILEDNGLSVHTTKSGRQGYKDILSVMRKFDFCSVNDIDTIERPDVEQVYFATKEAKERILNTGKPAFMRIIVERELEHVGIKSDYEIGYRKKPEEYMNAVDFYRLVMISKSTGSDSVFLNLLNAERGINLRIEEAIQIAKTAPFSDTDELYRGVFA